MTDWVYLSLWDGIGTKGVVKKVDVQLDDLTAELAVRWRVIDSPRGSLDVYGGVRYINMYQKVVIQPNAVQIDDGYKRIVDGLAERLAAALTSSRLRGLIAVEFRNTG